MRTFLSFIGAWASEKRNDVGYKRIPTSLGEPYSASDPHPSTIQQTTFEMSSLSSHADHAQNKKEGKLAYVSHHPAVSTREVDTGALVGEEEVFLDDAEALRIRSVSTFMPERCRQRLEFLIEKRLTGTLCL